MAERLLCAIPARAGSKRLPGKNLRPLHGKPMIAYSIEAARASGLFEDVYVCTEDEAIAQAARAFGAQVPFLMPPELCGDMVSSHTPCQRLADWLGEQGRPADALLCLQPTSPLRNAQDIQAAVERYRQGDVDFVVSVTLIDPHYFHWAVQQQKDGAWRMYFGDQFMVERPLLPTVYRPNGSIKIGRLSALRQTQHFFGPRLAVVETPEERSIHVATKFDADMCEFILGRS